MSDEKLYRIFLTALTATGAIICADYFFHTSNLPEGIVVWWFVALALHYFLWTLEHTYIGVMYVAWLKLQRFLQDRSTKKNSEYEFGGG